MPLNGSVLSSMIEQEYQSLGWNLANASHLRPLCQILGEGIVEGLLNRSLVTVTTTVTGGSAGSPGMAQGRLTLTMPQPAWEQSFMAELSALGWSGQSDRSLVAGLTRAVINHLASVMVLAGPIPGVAAGTAISRITLNSAGMQTILDRRFYDAGWRNRDKEGNLLPSLTTGAATLSQATARKAAELMSSAQTMMTIAGGATGPNPAPPVVDMTGYLQ